MEQAQINKINANKMISFKRNKTIMSHEDFEAAVQKGIAASGSSEKLVHDLIRTTFKQALRMKGIKVEDPKKAEKAEDKDQTKQEEENASAKTNTDASSEANNSTEEKTSKEESFQEEVKKDNQEIKEQEKSEVPKDEISESIPNEERKDIQQN